MFITLRLISNCTTQLPIITCFELHIENLTKKNIDHSTSKYEGVMLRAGREGLGDEEAFTFAAATMNESGEGGGESSRGQSGTHHLFPFCLLLHVVFRVSFT